MAPYFLIFIFISTQIALGDEPSAPEVVVRAKSLKTYNEVSYTPQSISVTGSVADVHVGEVLNKLPGVQVLTTSGLGSLTIAMTPQAVSSGSVSVDVDDIPIPNPSGYGINFSLFPKTLLENIESHSPFYPNYDLTANRLPAPGGSIHLKTLERLKPDENPWRASVLLGTANSIQATGAYHGGDETKDWLVGLSGFNTQGNFHYINPNTNGSENRQNNDSLGIGALGKYTWHLENGGSVEVLDFASHSERTNPGSLDFPTHVHERDSFNLLGMKYFDPTLFSKKQGFFGKLGGSYSRITTLGSVFERYDAKTLGEYGQMGYMHQGASTLFTLALDNEYDYLRNDTGVFNRNTYGATAALNFDLEKFQITPLIRQEMSSLYNGVTDGSISFSYLPDVAEDVSLSFGLQHLYPPVIAVYGYTSLGFQTLPNPNLNIERDELISLSYTRRKPQYTIYSGIFYDSIKDRAEFGSVNGSTVTSQYVNIPQALIFGYTLDGQWFPVDALSLRVSATLLRAWNQTTGQELSYKPRLSGLASLSYALSRRVEVTAEEQFVTKRLIVNMIDPLKPGSEIVLSPFSQTNLRIDWSVLKGIAFLKIENVFDQAGFVYPGYPYMGRSFWLGYSLQKL